MRIYANRLRRMEVTKDRFVKWASAKAAKLYEERPETISSVLVCSDSCSERLKRARARAHTHTHTRTHARTHAHT